MAKTDTALAAALRDAMAKDYSWLPESPAFIPHHDFSKSFDRGMSRILAMAGCRYVTIGGRQLRRALLIALIAVMILAMTAGGIAIQRALVHWNESQNDDAGTLDVTFDIDDPNQTAGQFEYVKPDTPAGYEVVSETKYSETEYEIVYENKEGNVIYYWQSGNVDTMGLSIDNEDADFREVEVNGYKGYAYSKLGNNAITWTDGTSLYDLMGTCEMSILEGMTKNISKK